MSFETITAQTVDYVGTASGRYVRSGIGFADPLDEFRLRPSTTVRKDGRVDITITRLLEKDDADGDRVQAVATLQVSLPKGDNFTMAEADSLVADISEFITADSLNEMFLGKS